MQTINANDLVKWLLDDSPMTLEAFGREQGFNERADVVYAADGTDLNEFWNEVQDTIRIRNADRSSILDRFTFRTQEVVTEVTVPSEVDFERASEYGQPVGIKGTAVRLFRGYDFDFYDLAIRYTWMSIAEMSQEQLRNNNNLALEADTKLQFMKVMQALFNPTNGNGFTDKNEPVTVYRFYNGDGEVPPKWKTNTFTGNHNHYLVSGNTAITPANVDTLQVSLEEHGYTLQSGYQMVLWVNKIEADIIRTFRVADGAGFDFVPTDPGVRGKVWVPDNGRYVGGPSGTVPGEIGTYGSFHVVEEDYIPSGYAVAIATGGADNLTNPIGYREHSNPAYRGLKIIPGQRSDYPLLDSFYRRGLGTGIRQRGAGAIMQIKATGNYQVPAQYDPTAY